MREFCNDCGFQEEVEFLDVKTNKRVTSKEIIILESPPLSPRPTYRSRFVISVNFFLRKELCLICILIAVCLNMFLKNCKKISYKLKKKKRV